MWNRNSKKEGLLYKIKHSLITDIALVFLAVLSIALLLFELSVGLTTQEIRLIHKIDLTIAFIFLFDFMIGIHLADNKKNYFKKHWTDLLASIPITEEVFRTFRALRLLRLARILSIVSGPNDGIDHRGRYITLSILATIIFLASSILFFEAEHSVNPAVTGFFDSVWWAVSTMTGTGESGIVPMTAMGRVIAGISMAFGIILIGTIAGLAGHHFIDKGKLKAIRKHDEAL